jgi:glycosyltransferase involved in cell wall biosynthesis
MNAVRNKRPVSIIYNGVNAPRISDQRQNDGVFRFIFANGFAAHKGFAKIIPAIRMVAERHNIEILVLGGGKTPQEIEGLPIKSIGLVPDVEPSYESSDAALFASVSEACSFAGIEAMAHSLPIVSTDAVGLKEMFGNAALFVQMNEKQELSAEEYASQMIRIIENKRLRSKLGILGYSRFLQKYTAAKMAKDTVRVYEKLLD